MAQQNSSSQQSSGTSFAGIQDPQSRKQLDALIAQLMGGGTPAQLAQRNQRMANVDETQRLLGDYRKRSAFQDAADLMNQNLAASMEAQKPAIQKAIEGSGTSAGSMQALLSQRLATSASQSAAALGAEQAKAYGNISASLVNSLTNQANYNDPVVGDLLTALDLTRISESKQQSTASSFGSSSDPQQSQGAGQAQNSGRASGGGNAPASRAASSNYGSDYGAGGGYVQSADGGFINAVPVDYGDSYGYGGVNDPGSSSYVPVYSRSNDNNSNIYSQNTNNGITTTTYEDQPYSGAANYYGSNSDTYANYYNSAQGAANRAVDDETPSYYDW